MSILPGDVIRELLQSSDAKGSRSTVLTDLRWLFAALASATLAAAWIQLPAWIVTLFAIGTTIDFALIVSSFIYLVRTNPDLLRTESYSLRKMEIERGLLGDSQTGLLNTEPSVVALPGSIDNATRGGGQ